MTNSHDIWVPLGDVYADIEQAYFDRKRDWGVVEDTTRTALLERLANGALRARPSGFSYSETTYGPPETHTELAGLTEDGCVPLSFWRDYRSAGRATFEPAAGDFSFVWSHASYDGETVGHASEVSVNWSGIPIIGKRPAPAGYATEAPLDRETERAAKPKGGRKTQYDPEQAFLYLAAYAHLSPDGLSYEGAEDASINGIAKILEGAYYPDDGPGPTKAKELARLVKAQIELLQRRGGR